MTPHPTYVVVRGEQGMGMGEVIYAGGSQEKSRRIAQKMCGERYFTKIEVWSNGELVSDDSGYTGNGHLTRGGQVIRDEETDVSRTVGEI